MAISDIIIKLIKANALLAQLDRVTGYEPVGQGFESLTAHQQKPHKHVVYVAFSF